MSILLPNTKLITTEEEFIKYILRKLGGLKFSVEICRDNWDDIISDTVDDVIEYGYNICYHKGFLPITLESLQSQYNLAGTGIIGVKKIYTRGDSIYGNTYEGLSLYQSMMGGISGNFINLSQTQMTGTNLGNFADYIVNYSNYKTIQDYFKTVYKPRFNDNTGILTIVNPPKQNMEGMMDCYILDPLEALWNNKYFKRLAEYWAIRQWEKNINGKYKVQFAAGESTISDVLTRAKEDYDKLIEDMKKQSNHGTFKHTQG